MSSRTVFAACWLVVLSIPTSLLAQDLTVERIWGSDDFSSDLVSIRWSRDGRSYTYVSASDGGADLYLVDAVSGEEERLVRGADLVPPGAERPIGIEQYEFSRDARKLLIFTNSVRVWRQNTKGEYFVWDLDRRRLMPVSTKPGYQMFAKFSPDGRLVGFVRENDLFVSDYATGREWQITTDGSEDVINGTSDWVYEEELGLRDAFRISPDGQYIAFWRFDQSAIRPFYMIDETTLYPELLPVRYPKAGESNSDVRIGLAEIESGETSWIDIGPDDDSYVARMEFANSSGELWFTLLNRHQNTLDLMLADVSDGTSRVVMTDHDEAWVENGEPSWFDEGRRFVYVSDRDGYSQLYLYDREGTLIRKLTDETWDVTTLYGVDERRGFVYFAAAAAGPLQRPVYRVDLEGREIERLTAEDGVHTASFNPTFTHFVDTFSRAGVPPVQTLRSADGRTIRVIRDNADLRRKVEALDLNRPEFMSIPIEGGEHLNAYIIKPQPFDSTRQYPLLMYVYGGPGSQTVTDSWGGAQYLWHQMLAQNGFLVASVDNRGTGARGTRFKKMTYLRLGQIESEDQIAAARFLGGLPYVDGGRIGIWGWSYGGYTSSLAMFRGGSVFRAAISVAPVTDWRLYDTIYTERYMRTPQENAEGYRLGAPLTYADQLEGAFLLVHGTGDDNVHSQNATRLVLALEEANKQFDMRLYPNKTHSIAGGVTRVNLYGLFTQWLQRNLYEARSVAEQIP